MLADAPRYIWQLDVVAATRLPRDPESMRNEVHVSPIRTSNSAEEDLNLN